MPRILLAAVLVAGLSPALTAAPDAGRSSIPLPGGVEALAAAVGAPGPFDRALALAETARIAYANPPGESASTDAARARLLAHVASLRAGLADATDTIPLPLAPRVWSDVILQRELDEDEIALAILENRAAALVYVGLSSLDAETLAFLADQRATLKRIVELGAAPFAAFGRSLKVRNGRLVTPGEDDARALWESVVLMSPDRPNTFLLRLFGSPGGRLAFLYDTVAHLDPAAVRYVMGLDLPPDERLEQFTELARIFTTAYPSWQVDLRPFSRPVLDGALLFRLLRFDADGRLAGPVWRTLWDAVFVEPLSGPEAGLIDAAPPAALARIDPSVRMNAAWVAGQVLSRLALSGRPRMEAVLFAQRVFEHATPADGPALVVALRGYLAFPALALSLERMGVRDPEFYARATRRAAALSAIGDKANVAVALAGFQSLLVMLEHAQHREALDGEIARSLVESLVALEPDAAAGYQGALVRWIDATLLPVLFEVTGESLESSSAERAVLKALAGPSRPRSGEPVEWEGHVYRLDPAAGEFARLEAVRANQLGNDLDRVLDFCRLASVAAERAAGTTPTVAAAVAAAARGLRPASLAAANAGAPSAVPHAVTVRLMERVGRGDARGATDVARSLAALGDALLADVLVSIVYAIHLGAPDGPALAAGNVALRHDFGFEVLRAAPWQSLVAWRLPEEDMRGGWHAVGSLLGLDVALSRFALRRLAGEGMPSMPALNGNDRHTFAQTVVLVEPRALDTDGMRAMVGGIAAGRQRVEWLAADPDGLDEVAEAAHLSDARREALRWALTHDPETVPRSFSRLELLWLGDPVRAAGLAAWGVSALPVTGCRCTDLAPPGAWEEFAGRPMTGQLATRIPDLMLRIAEELVRLRLPARLAADVLAAATYDLVYDVQPAHDDDWLAVVRWVEDVPAERFADYVSSLTAGGPLQPATGAPGAPWR